MAQTNVSFEMNEKLYDQMEDLCNELGLDVEDAFQLFAKKMVNEQEIPFEVTISDWPTDPTEEKVFHFIKWTVIVAALATALAVIVRLFGQLSHHR